MTDVYQVDGCRLEATHAVAENADGRFGAATGRRYTFTPEGCTLPVTAQGITYRAGPAYSDQFKDSDDGVEEGSFLVAKADDGYLLTSAPELDALWGAYGCAATDQIHIRFHVQP